MKQLLGAGWIAVGFSPLGGFGWLGLIWGANSDLFYINTSFCAEPGAVGPAARGGRGAHPAPEPRKGERRRAPQPTGQTRPSLSRVGEGESGE